MRKATEISLNLYHAEYQQIAYLGNSAQISFLLYITR
jgi:hypothetical protein